MSRGKIFNLDPYQGDELARVKAELYAEYDRFRPLPFSGNQRPSADQLRSWYSGIGNLGLSEDLQGWNSRGRAMTELLTRLKPDSVCEVGAWRGAGTVFIAEKLKSLGIQPFVVAVDVFFGQVGGAIGDTPSSILPPMWQMESGYHQFLYNIWVQHHDDSVVPVVDYTLNGARRLAHLGLKFGIVYHDASHLYEDAYRDSNAYWPLVQPGGAMVYDDFHLSYMGVKRAIDQFCDENNLSYFSDHGHAVIMKAP